jgi:tetratricopeptide (TPR) repeat protein
MVTEGPVVKLRLILFSAVLPIVALTPLAACTEKSAGYEDLAKGDYATARDELAPLAAQAPHDPYLELNLGWAYQNLGRMDLAEPLYRGAIADGRNVVPAETTNPDFQGKPIAAIACANLRAGLNNPAAC